MDRACMESLTNLLVTSHLNFPVSATGYDITSPEKAAAMTLFCFGSQLPYYQAAIIFGVSEFCLLKMMDIVIEGLFDLGNHLISWPKPEKYDDLVHDFDRIGKYFPNVVGAIDGMHVAISPRKGERIPYYNYKGFHSVHLQAICDSNMRFLDVFAGWPGRAHGARVFRASPWFHKMDSFFDNTNQNLCDTYHILADSAYPCLVNVIPAIKMFGNRRTQLNKKFNTHLASKRQVIERSFAKLVKRFARLVKLRSKHMDKNVRILYACCVLHNWCINAEDADDDFMEQPILLIRNDGNRGPPINQNFVQEAATKRAIIVNDVGLH